LQDTPLAKVASRNSPQRQPHPAAKQAEGIYKKAAIFTRKLATGPCIYQDGNCRLALVTTETFLNKKGKQVWTTNSQEAYKSIKNILPYNTDDIAAWLEHGPNEGSSNQDS